MGHGANRCFRFDARHKLAGRRQEGKSNLETPVGRCDGPHCDDIEGPVAPGEVFRASVPDLNVIEA